MRNSCSSRPCAWSEKSRISPVGSQRAFTLIELTIAMTLMALMMMVLYAAFHLGQRAMAKVQVRFEESHELRATMDLLGGYIRSAYTYRISPRDPAVFFSGDPERVTFVSALSLGMGGRGMAKITIAWERDGDEGGGPDRSGRGSGSGEP